MDKLVVDSSVIIKWFLLEPDSDKASEILEAYDTQEIEVIAPDVIYAEVGNIAWKRYTVTKNISVTEAQRIVSNFLGLSLETVPDSELLADAYRIAVTYGRSVYDSLYIALSVREQCRLVTADERLTNSVGTALPNVILLANWKSND